MTKDEINILILRSFSDELNTEQQHRLNGWINDSDENRKYYEQVKQLWHSVRVPQPENIPDFDLFWAELENRLNESPAHTPAVSKNASAGFAEGLLSSLFAGRRLVFGFGVTAIFIVIGILGYQYFVSPPDVRIYFTDKNSIKNITLPDGSTVKLNSRSEIRFEESFQHERSVHLKGQAFFSVRHDDTKFTVITDNASVEVLGTRFDVSTSQNKTRVVVEDGLVKLASASRHIYVLLRKNQMSQCISSGSPQQPAAVDAAEMTRWKDKKITFSRTPLKQVVLELGKYYNIRIALGDKQLENVTLSGEFGKQSAEEALSAVCLSLNLKYIRDKGVYYIYKRK